MNWQLELSQFIHTLPFFTGPLSTQDESALVGAPDFTRVEHDRPLVLEREALLLPALIAALFDYDESCGVWPPARVKDLLDLAGLDRVTSSLHLAGPNIQLNAEHRPLSRGQRQSVLLRGLGALDAGLLAESGQRFDELSHAQRASALSAFEDGELGFPRKEAEQFMDCVVETVTFAFLNLDMGESNAAGITRGGPQALQAIN